MQTGESKLKSCHLWHFSQKYHTSGKYKSPLLRGELDPRIEKHRKLEEIVNDDIDNWLCNLYFEVIKLPR